MENLSLTEAQVLNQLLSDPTGKTALLAFLGNQREYHLERSAEFVMAHKLDEAFEAAIRADVHETMILELRHFIENQLRSAA
jgi:hypothetical protein